MYYVSTIASIYQVALQKGWYIPRFCFSARLAIAGNCRMCFVEVEKISKPIVSCATLISDKLSFYTSSILIFKAREAILEFLLINHPLDCPICDQGGECDSQDQYMVMGNVLSRYYELSKKNLVNKDLSFLIKLSLNKCINCTRCTRFSHNVMGNYNFSMLGRGEFSSISNYTYNNFFGEIVGNIIDLCPVGALVSKITSYNTRFWELTDVKYVDFLDILQPPIRLDFRGLHIIRVLPLSNLFTQEEWISDKLRFGFKVFFKKRFFNFFLKIKSFMLSISYLNLLIFIKNYFIKLLNFFNYKKKFFYINFNAGGDDFDLFKIFIYKKYFKKLNKLNYYNKKFNYDNFFQRSNFILCHKNLNFLNIDIFIIFNLNIRFELPILNYKIREKIFFDYIYCYYYGAIINFNFYFIHKGNNCIDFFYSKNYFSSFSNIHIFNNLSEKNKLYEIMTSFCLKKNISLLNLINLTSSDLISNELNFLNFKKINFFDNFFLFKFNFGNNLFNNKNFNKNYKILNIFFNNNFDNLKKYNALIPLRHNFEQSSFFLNIFGVFSDFMFINFKFFYSIIKEDIYFLRSLFELYNLKRLKISLNDIKLIFVPKNWVLSEYALNLFFWKNIKINGVVLLFKKFYFIKFFSLFYNSIFKNFEKIFFKNIINFNFLSKFSKINSVQWLY